MLSKICVGDAQAVVKCLKSQLFRIFIRNLTILGRVISVPNYILMLGMPKSRSDEDGRREIKKMKKKEVVKRLKWSRPVIVKHVGEDRYDLFCEKTLNEFQKLEPGAPVYRESMNRQNFSFGVLGLSIYRVLLSEFGFETARAFDVLNDFICDSARQTREHSPLMRFMYSKMSRWKFLVKAANKKMEFPYEPDGWLFKIPKSDAYWAMDILQCGLVKYLKDQGAPEICKAFCNADYVAAEYMTGLNLVRTKTLADGDDLCDFRYYKERMVEKNESNARF